MRIALCLTLIFLSSSCIFVGHRRRGGCIRVCTVEAQAAEVAPESTGARGDEAGTTVKTDESSTLLD